MFSKKYNKKLKKKQHPEDMKGFKISTPTKQYSPFEMTIFRTFKRTSKFKRSLRG